MSHRKREYVRYKISAVATTQEAYFIAQRMSVSDIKCPDLPPSGANAFAHSIGHNRVAFGGPMTIVL